MQVIIVLGLRKSFGERFSNKEEKEWKQEYLYLCFGYCGCLLRLRWREEGTAAQSVGFCGRSFLVYFR